MSDSALLRCCARLAAWWPLSSDINTPSWPYLLVACSIERRPYVAFTRTRCSHSQPACRALQPAMLQVATADSATSRSVCCSPCCAHYFLGYHQKRPTWLDLITCIDFVFGFDLFACVLVCVCVCVCVRWCVLVCDIMIESKRDRLRWMRHNVVGGVKIDYYF